MDKKLFGKNVQKYREKSGYSQETLAELVGCSTIFISYIERGEKSPSINTLIKLSNALNTSTDILLGKDSKCYSEEFLKDISDRLRSFPPKKQERILEIIDSIISIETSYQYKEE